MASPAYAQMSCNELTNLSIPNTSITAATPVSAGDAVPSGLGGTVTAPVDFCRVRITLTPVDGSTIQMEVWLHPQSFVDFGHRATHLMTVTGKQVTEAYYGQPQTYAYFTGCSSGGRQALKEAQMFPDDYNGILAGDPANDWVNLNVDQIYEVQVNLTESNYLAHLLPRHDAASLR
jgi:hypothetical protein